MIRQVQSVDSEIQVQPLVEGEPAINLHVPLADRVRAQGVDILRELANLITAGLEGRASFEPDKSSRDRGRGRVRRVEHRAVDRGGAVLLAGIGGVRRALVERLNHLGNRAVVKQIAPTHGSPGLVLVDPAQLPAAHHVLHRSVGQPLPALAKWQFPNRVPNQPVRPRIRIELPGKGLVVGIRLPLLAAISAGVTQGRKDAV